MVSVHTFSATNSTALSRMLESFINGGNISKEQIISISYTIDSNSKCKYNAMLVYETKKQKTTT